MDISAVGEEKIREKKKGGLSDSGAGALGGRGWEKRTVANGHHIGVGKGGSEIQQCG
jgi:hypothetical protein